MFLGRLFTDSNSKWLQKKTPGRATTKDWQVKGLPQFHLSLHLELRPSNMIRLLLTITQISGANPKATIVHNDAV